MSLVASVLGLDKREFSLSRWVKYLDYPIQSESGIVIDHDTALKVAAVYACVRIIAETVATLPIALYEPLPGGGRREVKDDPLYELLQYEPNPEQTGCEFWEMNSHYGALCGNSITWIKRRKRDGQPLALWPIALDRVRIERKNGLLLYRVRNQNGTETVLFDDDVMHFKIFTKDGVMGMSPLQFARDNFGLAVAQERFSNSTFRNGAKPSGILTYPPDMEEEEREAAKAAWQAANAGVENAGNTAVLPADLKWTQISLKHEELEFIKSRQFQIAEIARIFRVPLPLLQELERATFNNIEHLSLDFVIHTIRPWLTRWEQTIRKSLLTPDQRARGMYVKFNERALLRGAMKDQAEFFSKMLMAGVYTINEVRDYMDLNPVEGGDKNRVQMQNVDINLVDELSQTESDSEEENDENQDQDDKDKSKKQSKKKKKERKSISRAAEIMQERAKNAFQHHLRDEIGRIYRKESAAVCKNAAKLTVRDFSQWLDGFADEQRDLYAKVVFPIVARSAQVFDVELTKQEIRARVDEKAQEYGESIKSRCRQFVEDRGGDWKQGLERFYNDFDSFEEAEERAEIELDFVLGQEGEKENVA